MKKVVIIQRRLCDYRVPLFEQLKSLLAKDDVELRLLYGNGTPEEYSKNDGAEISWGEKLITHYFFGNRICWQPYYSKLKDADFVIVTQENKLINNLWPLFGWRDYKLAFWGHGKNMQKGKSIFSSIKEHIKFVTTNRVDWWFVYTGLSLKFVSNLRFSTDKITNLENSIDTTGLRLLCDSVTDTQLCDLRVKLNLGDGPIGLYVGSLYKEKRLEFLIEACVAIVKVMPDFRLVIIGDGPQKTLIQNAATEYAWLRYVGRQVDGDKAKYLKLASVLLNPGLVGLGILDAFGAGIPVITTDCGLHSPEIDYLRNGYNGFITHNTRDDYVATVVRMLSDDELAISLKAGSIASANHYTIENMAQNFRNGILKALQAN